MKMQAFFNSLRRHFPALLLLGLLSSCQFLHDDVLVPSSIPTTQPQPSLTNSPAPTQGVIETFPAVSATPTLTSSPTPAGQQPCSPLADHSLEALPQIVSQPYDPPPPGSDARHHGVDFFYYGENSTGSIAGEAIQAILPGMVVAAINDRLPYGNALIIETSSTSLTPALRAALGLSAQSSIYHLYAHMEAAPVFSIGDSIICGQRLGQVGQTGYNIPVPHLHLETRIGPPAAIFESMVFYDTQATLSEQDNYLRWRTGGNFEHFDPMLLLQQTP